MIRAASKCGAIAVHRAACALGRTGRGTSAAAALSSAVSSSSSSSSSSFSSAAARTGDPLPPNLSFDRRSSFSPREAGPVPVAPPPRPTADDDDDDDGEDHRAEEPKDGSEEEEASSEAAAAVADWEEEADGGGRRRRRPIVAIPLPDRLNVAVHGVDGSINGTLWLDETVFGVDPIRIDLIKQSVDYVRNKIRGVRKAKSKTISEVSGSGRKVRKQKGTGMARAGHSRPAHWRGGAKAHGPKNTVDYGKAKMNKKARRAAMVSTLSQKLKEGNLIVVDHLNLESHKTKHLASMLEDSYGIGKGGHSALVLDHYLETEDDDENDDENRDASFHGVPINLWVASGNVYKIKVASQRYANVYDVLKKDKLVITLGALAQMEARWKD